MKKTLLTNLKFIAFGLILALGISAYAAWSGPTAPAPGNNIAVPIHAGPSQIKTTGDCTANNCGGLSVGPFAAYSNSEFDGQVFFNGMIRGGAISDSNSQVKFGDTTPVVHTVNGVVAGDVAAVGALQSAAIANSSNGTLCAAADGTIAVCGTTTTSSETYSVPAQTLVYPYPDYAYDGSQANKYIPSVCLSSPALRTLPFTINYTSDTGQVYSTGVTVRSGQICSDKTASQANIVTSAPHTRVGPATAQCTYQGTDTTYQSPPYQGYAVTVDPSLRCR